MKDKGLYTGKSEEDFLSDREISRKHASEEPSEPIYDSKVPQNKSVFHWISRAFRRSQEMKIDTMTAEGNVNIRLPATSMVSMIGDIHHGSPETDYKRFEGELNTILKTKNSYVCLMGDLVDGFFWGGTAQSEQSANMEEQFLFLQSLFKALKGKVLLAVSGEHDSKWSSKTGMDPYANFSELTGAPYVRGIAEVNLKVDEQDYKFTAQHCAKGYSMYNKSHPGMRNSLMHIQGADSYNSAHTHQKAVAVQSIRDFGGQSHEVVYGVVGPYKRTDEYAQRKGYVPLGDSEMGGYTLLFDSTEKKVEPELNIKHAHKKWG
jgi:hypothetical protein